MKSRIALGVLTLALAACGDREGPLAVVTPGDAPHLSLAQMEGTETQLTSDGYWKKWDLDMSGSHVVWTGGVLTSTT